MFCWRTALRGSFALPSAAERPSRMTGFDTAATFAPCSIRTREHVGVALVGGLHQRVRAALVSLAFTSAPRSSSADGIDLA
jgi:hypothetical protein